MKRYRFPVELYGNVYIEAEDIKDARAKLHDLAQDKDDLIAETRIHGTAISPALGKVVADE